MTDNIEETTEAVVEALEPVAKAGVKFASRHKTHIVLAGVAGLVVGAAGGVLASRAAWGKVFQAKLEEEAGKIRDFYERENKVGPFSDPEAALQYLHPEEVIDYAAPNLDEAPEPKSIRPADAPAAENRTNYNAVSTPTKADETAALAEATAQAAAEAADESRRHVFDEGVGAYEGVREFDYDVEIPKRDGQEAYVITRDEFDENEADYEQVEYTYYEGDDTLADEAEVAQREPEESVGRDALVSFGWGSADPAVVYFRNDKKEIVGIISRNSGRYTEEVLGMVPAEDLKHSAIGNRRMRDRDD